jgi:hypothetical protein
MKPSYGLVLLRMKGGWGSPHPVHATPIRSTKHHAHAHSHTHTTTLYHFLVSGGNWDTLPPACDPGLFRVSPPTHTTTSTHHCPHSN